MQNRIQSNMYVRIDAVDKKKEERVENIMCNVFETCILNAEFSFLLICLFVFWLFSY